jgi:hypothetical protein
MRVKRVTLQKIILHAGQFFSRKIPTLDCRTYLVYLWLAFDSTELYFQNEFPNFLNFEEWTANVHHLAATRETAG